MTRPTCVSDDAAYHCADRLKVVVFCQPTEGSVMFESPSGTDHEVFSSVRKSEIIDVLSFEASREFRKRDPERCEPTHFVERWKPTGDGKAKLKSRMLSIGWKDPIFQLQRSAPTQRPKRSTAHFRLTQANMLMTGKRLGSHCQPHDQNPWQQRCRRKEFLGCCDYEQFLLGKAAVHGLVWETSAHIHS